MGRLKDLIAVTGMVTNIALLDSFLTGVTNVIALTVIAALMSGLCLVGGLLLLYLGMTHYGVEPFIAALVVTGAALFIAASLVITVVLKLRDLRKLSHYTSHSNLPIVSRIGRIADAFIDGFTRPGRPH
jgi:hypothetical protein